MYVCLSWKHTTSTGHPHKYASVVCCHSKQLLIILDYSWQLLTTLDNSWQLLTTLDNSWQLLTTLDNSWQLLTIFDNLTKTYHLFSQHQGHPSKYLWQVAWSPPLDLCGWLCHRFLKKVTFTLVLQFTLQLLTIKRL